jgi:Sulfotransferase family
LASGLGFESTGETSPGLQDREGPVFIVGCGRSGTTMLMLMLDRHPQLAIPTESHFIMHQWRQRRSMVAGGSFQADVLTKRILQSDHFRRWDVPEEIVWHNVHALDKPGFADVIRAVFLAYAATQGKPRWGDKTPVYVHELDLLARLFPDARFIHIIRDGRDVALSYSSHESAPWGPMNVSQAALKWRRDVNAGRRSGALLGGSRYIEVRYESLVDDAQGQLEAVCRFLDLPFEQAMLKPDERGELKLRHYLRHNRPAYSRSLEAPIRGARDWRWQMPASDARDFESVAGDLLTLLEYERRFPHISPLRRVRASGQILTYDLHRLGSRTKSVVRQTATRSISSMRTRILDRRHPQARTHPSAQQEKRQC